MPAGEPGEGDGEGGDHDAKWQHGLFVPEQSETPVHSQNGKQHHGDNEIGLTAAEAIAEIDRLMKKYGSWARVDIITLIEDLATETDMTAFLESSEVE